MKRFTKAFVAAFNGPIGDQAAADTIRELAKDPATAHIAAFGAAFEAAGRRGRSRRPNTIDALPHESHVFDDADPIGDGCAKCGATRGDPEAFAPCDPPIAGPCPSLAFWRSMLLGTMQARGDRETKKAPPPSLSTLIATVIRELRARGLSQVAYDIDRADDDVEIRSVRDLRKCVGRWSVYLTDETRAAIGAAR